MATIKAGYRLTVVSWENDGDHYNTVIKDGLEEVEVGHLVKLLSMLKKAYHDGGHGNLYEPDDVELERFAKAIEALGSEVTDFLTYGQGYKETSDLTYDFMEMIYDYTGSSEGYYTRMVEFIGVEFVSEEITFLDVSASFGITR